MTGPEVVFRSMAAGEEERVLKLVKLVFDQFESREYSVEGIHEFYRYANPAAMRKRAANHLILVAESAGQPIGMIEIRDCTHIALLFVHPDWHRQGIASTLFRRGVDLCRQQNDSIHFVTVNASPYAVDFYQKLGFLASQPENEVRGIRFTPMTLMIRTGIE